MLVVQVGLVGLEPTSTGLRDRCIASSATTPIASRSGRNRTSGLDLIRVLLSPLSYAPIGAGGTRTHTCRIKSPVCCRYTTTLCLVGRMRLSRVNIASLLFLRSVSSGNPENRTQRHLFIGQVWATSPRLPRANVVVDPVGMAGLEPAFSCSQGTRVSHYPTSRHSVRTAGFEPAISCTPSRRDTGLRYVLPPVARAGIEPASPP